MEFGSVRIGSPRCLPRTCASIRVGEVSKNDAFKLQMALWYSEYSKTYDSNGYHTRMANRLVEGLEIKQGARILDIATGTGLAGFAALERAGENGSLVAVDISKEMLKVASNASEARGLRDVEFVLADAQKLDLSENSFDVLMCSSALVLFPDEEWTLSYWKKFLVPGGRLAVHCFSEKSYVRGKILQKAAAENGIELIFSEPTGTVDKCIQLLENCGYTSIAINTVENGSYISLSSVLEAFDKTIMHPMVQLPSRVKSGEVLHKIKQRYIQLAKELETEKGLWDDDTVMYVYGQRPLTDTVA